MDIFETGHTRLRRTLRNILPVIIPAVLCLIFYLGISCAGRETISREQSSLQQAGAKRNTSLCSYRSLSPEPGRATARLQYFL